MVDWWNHLTLTQQVFAVFGIVGTAILILQTVLLLFGLGHDGMDSDADADIDADLDGDGDVDAAAGGSGLDGLRLFTVRGFVAFFSISGWLGVFLLSTSVPYYVAILLAIAGGFAAMIFVAWAFKKALRLQDNGTLQMSNAIGRTGRVYLRIPANRQGSGKITILIQDQQRELDAVTSADQEIPVGASVRVVDVDQETRIVEPV